MRIDLWKRKFRIPVPGGLQRARSAWALAYFLFGAAAGSQEVSDVNKYSGSEIWELAEDTKYPGQELVRLEIPKRYAYHMPGSTAPHRGLMYFFAFYPDFSAATDSQNANVNPYRCPGYCNGLLVISLENVGLHRNNANATELYAHNYLNKRVSGDRTRGNGRSTVKIVEHTPQFGFDIIFDEVASYKGETTLDNKFLMKYDKTKLYFDLVAECDLVSQNKTCELIFSSRCAPGMAIKVGRWEYSRMALALDVWRRADKFVHSMIQNDDCKS